MPNLITHALFGEEVYKQVDDPKIKKIIKNHHEEYIIGCNGPDFLFFYDTFPLWKKQDLSINKIGSRLHRESINQQYLSFVKTIRQTKEPKLKEAMISYVVGHYLHWQLDSVFHPYVVYLTGFGKPENKFHHHQFESTLDAFFLEYFNHQTIKKYKTYQICERSELSEKVIPIVYCNLIKDIFDLDINKQIIIDSLKDWEKTQHYLYDPHNLKIPFLKLYETIIRVPMLVSGMLVPNKVKLKYDVTNQNHKTWLHPVSGEKFNFSALELMEIAKRDALIGIKYLMKAINTGESDELLNFIDDKTYANGIKGSQERKYQGDIYAK